MNQRPIANTVPRRRERNRHHSGTARLRSCRSRIRKRRAVRTGAVWGSQRINRGNRSQGKAREGNRLRLSSSMPGSWQESRSWLSLSCPRGSLTHACNVESEPPIPLTATGTGIRPERLVAGRCIDGSLQGIDSTEGSTGGRVFQLWPLPRLRVSSTSVGYFASLSLTRVGRQECPKRQYETGDRDAGMRPQSTARSGRCAGRR